MMRPTYPVENINPAFQGDTLEGGEHCQHKVVEVGDPKIGPLWFWVKKDSFGNLNFDKQGRTNWW